MLSIKQIVSQIWSEKDGTEKDEFLETMQE